MEQERRAVGTHFVARLGRARAADVLELCRAWRPGVVVRDEVDFGSAVAAEAAGLPHAAVVVIGAGGFIRDEIVREPLDALAAELGLEESDSIAMLHRHLTLTPFPARYRDPEDPVRGNVVGYQLPAPAASRRNTERTVYVTLGTIFNTESGDLLRTAALGAAAAADVDRVVVATGEHVDPATLGPLPDHVVVRQFVQQDEVLTQGVAVVSHAGSGTVLGALRHGLPSVGLPMGADQHLNARRLEQLELGVTLPADTVTSADVRTAVQDVLSSTPIRRSVSRMRDQIRALPDVAHAVSAVERLVE